MSNADKMKSSRPERYHVVSTSNGDPAVEARFPDGRREIVAVMTNTEMGHELADMVCECRNHVYILI